MYIIFFLAEGKSEKMATWTQDLIMTAVTFDWSSLSVISPSSPESKTLSLGRLWCFGKTLEVWIFWLLWPWFLEHMKHILLVFCPLSALTVPLCLVNCVKSLLKTCHSVLAQRQTDLLVPLFCWRLIHLARKFCQWCSLLCSSLHGVTIFDLRNYPVTAVLHIHLAQNRLTKLSQIDKIKMVFPQPSLIGDSCLGCVMLLFIWRKKALSKRFL